MSRLYLGDSALRVVVMGDGAVHALPHRRDLRDHSPDGFNWGYGGSGPAQLALALCCDVLGDDAAALEIYQAFKFNYVGRLRGGAAWGADADQLRAIMAGLRGREVV